MTWEKVHKVLNKYLYSVSVSLKFTIVEMISGSVVKLALSCIVCTCSLEFCCDVQFIDHCLTFHNCDMPSSRITAFNISIKTSRLTIRTAASDTCSIYCSDCWNVHNLLPAYRLHVDLLT